MTKTPREGKQVLLRIALLPCLGLALSGTAAPVNDSFATAIPLTGPVLITGSNVGASSEANEPLHAGQPGGKSVWWSWTASRAGSVMVSTFGSDFDTLLGVYIGAAPGSLSEIASNDDASLIETTSQLSFIAAVGTTYRIAVDGIMLDESEADEGTIQLTILDNDMFLDASPLAGTAAVAEGHNVGASREPGEPSHAGQPASRSVWWTWTAPENGAIDLRLSGDNITAQGAAFFKLLAVYTGAAVEGLTPVATHGSAFTLTNQFSVDVVAGVQYRLAADGVSGASGRLRLDLGFTPAPANDSFAQRFEITGIAESVAGSNVGARKESGEPNHAGGVGGHSVWWTWTAPANGNLTLAMSGDILSKLLAVYTGAAVDGLTLVRSNFTADPTNRVSFAVMSGVSYHIAVDGLNGQVGDIVLDLLFSAVGANDDFANRMALAGGDIMVAGSNVGASAEPLEPNHGGYAPTRSVWWSWIAPATGVATVTVSGDNSSVGGGAFYKLIGVYVGSGLESLTTNKLSSGLTLTNRVSFDVVGGTAYQIAVDGHNGAQGAFHLTLGFTSAPGNDDFENRIFLAGASVMISGSNIGATKQTGEPNHAGPGGRSVWWSWTAPAEGEVVISTAGSTFNTLLAVYRGLNVSGLTLVASNNDFEGRTSQVAFNAIPGTPYHIAIDGLLQASGTVQLSLLSQAGESPSLITPRFDGTFQFSFTGPINASYFIEASTNLTEWTSLVILTNTTGTVEFTDPDAQDFPHRFYRTRQQ